MIEANAWFFDRDVPYRTMVRLLFEDEGRLRIEGEGVALNYPLDEIRFTRDPDGHTRIIELPDGSRCASLDIERLEAALQLHGLEEQVFKAASRLKGQGRWIAGGLAGVLLLLMAAWLLLLPPWAERSAQALPPATVQGLSQRVLGLLATNLGGSTISAQREQRLNAQWRLATQDLAEVPYPLLFRATPKLGPLLFALPDGTFVVSDPLLQTLNDEVVVALLLHELGHVRSRHALITLWRQHPLQALTSPPSTPQTTADWAILLLDFLEHGPYPAHLEVAAANFAAPRLAALDLPDATLHWALAQVEEAAQRGNFPMFYSDLHLKLTAP